MSVIKSADYKNYRNNGLPEFSNELREFMPTELKEFWTKDLYLAAAILAFGGILDKIDRTDRRHMKFYFRGNGLVLEELESDWTNGKVEGNLLAFATGIRRMKSEIHKLD